MSIRRLLSSVTLLTIMAASGQGWGEPGTWTSMAPAPSSRTEVAVAVLNSKIYVLGGFADPNLSNIANMTVSNSVEVYDPAEDTWTTAASLPIRLHHTGSAVTAGRLYVIGGFTTEFLSLWNPVNSAYSYDPVTGTWAELAPMPTARGALAVAQLDGKLYAVGGIGAHGNSDAVEVYDPATKSWSTKAPLPTPRDHLAVAVVGDRLYAIAGRLNGSYSRNLGVVEAYDPKADQWQTVAALPTPRSGIAAAVIRGNIYVVGGEAPEGTFQTNEVYTPASDRWHEAAPMPTARHGLGAAAVHDRIYVISGGPTPGGSYSNVNERYEPSARRTTGPRSPASSKHVGTVMALLATFHAAGALPPEASPEATRLIRALIQFQSAFTWSASPAVQQLLHDALSYKLGRNAATAEQRFRSEGWTSHSLEAVVDYVGTNPIWKQSKLLKGFHEYNIGQAEFELLADVFNQTRTSLAADGRDVHAVYAEWRRDMPGATM